MEPWCFKNSETLLGIETPLATIKAIALMGFKNSETLLGIETTYPDIFNLWAKSFKNSETLLGIETYDIQRIS